MDVGEWSRTGEWPATPELNKNYREIRRLGLETNLAELEAFGFTVIRDALRPGQTARLRDLVLRAAETRIERELDLEKETGLTEDQLVTYLLYRDPAFEEGLLNPGPLSLITYMLGYSCLLSSVTSHVKGPGKIGLMLHADSVIGTPGPFTFYSQVANINYALTDYTEDAGALAMLPGSHRYSRQPTAVESGVSGNERNPDIVPVEVPAGSAIIWGGSQWHGAFPRKAPGLRVNLAYFFCRPYMTPFETYSDRLPPDLIERHGRDSRLAQLIGLNSHYGWRDDAPQKEELYKMRMGQTWQS